MSKAASKSTVSSMNELMKVALGEAQADLAIVNGEIVNVYTSEVVKGNTVLIKGDKIACVGRNAGKSIGPATNVIDADGKTLIPGLIDGHTHLDFIYSLTELMRFAMKGGTTTIITEVSGFVFPLGYQGIIEFLRSAHNQPIKILITAPAMVTINPAAEEHALNVAHLRRLLKRKEVLGLGESYWGPVIAGDQRTLDLIAETMRAGKRVEGHTAGAKGNRLQAYISLGVTSDHEPINAEEVLERLRAGLTVFAREGTARSDLEPISKLKDKNIDFRHLALATDGLDPAQLIEHGYMEFIVQKAINLGFKPITAIQMATINVAQHFGIDNNIGGIAPGKHADILIIRELKTILPEYVISNGRIVAKDGELLVQPRKHTYLTSTKDSINLHRDFTADDFTIKVPQRDGMAKVRLIDLVTNSITREAVTNMPVSSGVVQTDISQDVVKVAAIDRIHHQGKTFTGLIRGTGFKRGAIASSLPTDCWTIIVIGAIDSDMALAVNRIRELHGGTVVCASNAVLAELPLPIGGIVTPEPMEIVAEKLCSIQQAVASLGCTLPNISNTLGFLGSESVPFLRISEEGLIDIMQNRIVGLLVD